MSCMTRSFHSPSGWYGLTEGPPSLSTSNPETNRAWSRTISAGKRKRRQHGRHPGLHFLSRDVVGAANQQEGVFTSGPLSHYHHSRETALEFFFFDAEGGEPLPRIADFRRRGIVQVIPAKLQVLDFA